MERTKYFGEIFKNFARYKIDKNNFVRQLDYPNYFFRSSSIIFLDLVQFLDTF